MSEDYNLRNCREVRKLTDPEAVNGLLEDPAGAIVNVRTPVVKKSLERTKYNHDYFTLVTRGGEQGHVLVDESLHTRYIVGRFCGNGSSH